MLRFIATEKGHHHVTTMCARFEVDRQRFSDWQGREPTAGEAEDQRLGDRIESIWEDSKRTFGAPRLTSELRFAHGWPVSPKAGGPADAPARAGRGVAVAAPAAHHHPRSAAAGAGGPGGPGVCRL